jgi:prepilin-type N-terminal cleavage/methylation domain-containing protein
MKPITNLFRRGFSLADVLIALVLVGIVSGIAYPVYVNITTSVNWSAAVAKANTLNAAQASFKAAEPSYATLWTGDSQAKYTLLRAYIPGAPVDLAYSAGTGFEVSDVLPFVLGTTVDTRVTIAGADTY